MSYAPKLNLKRCKSEQKTSNGVFKKCTNWTKDKSGWCSACRRDIGA